MGVRNIGFSSVLNGTSHRADEHIFAETQRTGTYLVWTTDSGSETHESFTVSISWSGIPNGMSVQTPQSEVITKVIPTSSLNEHTSQYASGVFWAVGLSEFDGLLAELGEFSGDNITFQGRNYDLVTFNVSICANYKNPDFWGEVSSPYESSQVNITFVPEYVITDVYYDTPEIIVIEYTAEGWNRNDDRWALNRCKLSDGTPWFLNSNSIMSGNTYGTVSKFGRIEMPASALTKSVMDKKIRIMIRWVAGYLPNGHPFNDDTKEFVVTSKIVKNTPTISLLENDGRKLTFEVGDSGDFNAEIDTVTVKMEDGKYSFDTVTVSKDGDVWPKVEFPFCPYNKQLSFVAIGTKGYGASSPVGIDGIVIKNRNKTSFDSIDGSASVDLCEDIQTQISTSNNHSTVQFAGRRRKSAFYGSGGSTTLSFSASMLFNDAEKFLSIAQSELEGAGDVVVRLPDGKRYAIAVDSCDVSWTLRNQKTVSISGEEVDA